MSHLLIRQGKRAERWDLVGSTVIGRSAECDLILKDENVSRRHCRIEMVDQGWLLTDMASSNGTIVDGEPVRRRLLKDGAEITVGGALIMLVDDREQRAGRPGSKQIQRRDEDSGDSIVGEDDADNSDSDHSNSSRDGAVEDENVAVEPRPNKSEKNTQPVKSKFIRRRRKKKIAKRKAVAKRVSAVLAAAIAELAGNLDDGDDSDEFDESESPEREVAEEQVQPQALLDREEIGEPEVGVSQPAPTSQTPVETHGASPEQIDEEIAPNNGEASTVAKTEAVESNDLIAQEPGAAPAPISPESEPSSESMPDRAPAEETDVQATDSRQAKLTELDVAAPDLLTIEEASVEMEKLAVQSSNGREIAPKPGATSKPGPAMKSRGMITKVEVARTPIPRPVQPAQIIQISSEHIESADSKPNSPLGPLVVHPAPQPQAWQHVTQAPAPSKPVVKPKTPRKADPVAKAKTSGKDPFKESEGFRPPTPTMREGASGWWKHGDEANQVQWDSPYKRYADEPLMGIVLKVIRPFQKYVAAAAVLLVVGMVSVGVWRHANRRIKNPTPEQATAYATQDTHD